MKSRPYSLGRTVVLALTLLLFTLLILGRLFWVQVVHSETYAEKADRQYVTPAGNIFERGSIYFTRKDGELVSGATQTSGYKVAVNPGELRDKKIVYEKISRIIPLDQAEFREKSDKEGDPYEEIANRLTKKEADAISALKLPGVSVFKEKWRFYPGEKLAAHALGIIGYKGDELSGRYGLEREYDDILSRSDDHPYVNFFAEVFTDLFSGGGRGGDIVTTIEPSVQGALEGTLRKTREKYSADLVGGIIMNPRDGSIYALAATPSFDPNNFKGVEDVSVFKNPLVENIYEFGSVVKPLVMAGALDALAVTAETTYDDQGSTIVEKKEIFNFDKRGRGVVNMQEVLGQSLNTGMVYVAKKLGKDRMRSYLYAFGIKDKTEIDLPGEVPGWAKNLESPREIEYANASFGQGLALTPIGLARALASLGNGGQLVSPHVVKEIKYSDGLSKKMEYTTRPTKISQATSEEITRMLVSIMDKSLRGGADKFEHYSVAVKTGTAQVPKPGGYWEDRYTHSFFGYFPAYDPEFLVLLYAVNPRGTRYASETWTDPFLAITKFLLNYYEVPPDR